MEHESADLELAGFLRSLGATDEQIEVARTEGHLTGLAADLVLSEGAEFSAADLASRAGVDLSRVLTVWRLLGITITDVDRPMFSEVDAQLTTHIAQFGTVGPDDELLRVLGSALGRVAEAAVSLYVQTVEPQLSGPDVDAVVWAKDLAATTAMALQLGNSMGTIFGHHLRDAIVRQRIAQAAVAERSLSRLAIGFVDLVGFTPLSRNTAPTELLELIGRFEARAFDLVVAHEGWIVKHIGDEIMFAALDARSGCVIGEALTRAFDAEGIEPRGGVAFGDVISRHGDYYGPVVNLASRLADLAIPKEVLVDAATAAAATAAGGAATGEEEDGLAFAAAGRRLPKGFDEPVEVFSLVSHGAG